MTVKHRIKKQVKLDLSFLEHQRPVFNSKARYVVYAKGRRAGGTEGAARKCLQLVLVDHPGCAILWVDTVHRNILRYVKRYFLPRLRPLPQSSGGEEVYRWRVMEKTMSFYNGSYIDFGSADNPENLEGFAYDYIFLNEAGIILWNEDLYHSTLAPMAIEGAGAQWFFIGAPKGKNLFSKFFQMGLNPDEPDWASFRHISSDNPIVNKDYVEKMRKRMPEQLFRQEILAEFIDDAGFFKNLDTLVGAVREVSGASGIEYVIGLDLAKQVDYTVAWVGRLDSRTGVYCERYNRLAWPTQVLRIKELARLFNNAVVLLDATSFGGAIATDDLAAAGVSVVPMVFTPRTKEEVLTALAVDIEQERLRICHHEETGTEMRAFQQITLPGGTTRLSAPPGFHDDCVIALALMNWQFGRPASFSVEDVVGIPGIGFEQSRDPLLN